MSPEPAVLEVLAGGRVFGAGPGAVRALHEVDLRLQAGEFVAVTGRSGSGKSTLLNVLGLLDRLSSGRYLVDGEDVTSQQGRRVDVLRARTFGFVFQAFHLVPYLTTRENVELGLTYDRRPTAHRRRRVDELVDRVGLGDRGEALTATLSGGERQRVAVARALIRDPVVLLADEPTGNLDERSADTVLELFEDVVRAGVALVLVTHDEQTAARAHRRLRMRDGVLSE